jgi:probable O-glycosylation ligase (exosortase A-associated)
MALIMILPAAYYFMPESWHARMETIKTYKHDQSAEGRINAWWTAYHVAVARPIVGGGAGMFVPWVFWKYAPDPSNVHDAHSIYFETLGEQGFVGLFLFLLLGFLALSGARRIVRETKDEPRLFWMRDLASMVHVSLISYAASGAFLGLAYFDFYYDLLAVLVGLQWCLTMYQEQDIREASAQAVELGPAVGGLASPGGAVALGRSRALRNRGLGLREWFDRL